MTAPAKRKWFDFLRGWLRDRAREALQRALRRLGHATVMAGTLEFVCTNPDGSVAWRAPAVLNGDTYPGLNDMLSVYFNSGTQKTEWFCGLIDSSGFSTLSANDTIASHAGWSESTAYDEATRQQLTFGSPSTGVIAASAVTFTSSGTVTIKGAFFVSNGTKGGATGTLFCTANLDSEQALTVGQTLAITFRKTLTPS